MNRDIEDFPSRFLVWLIQTPISIGADLTDEIVPDYLEEIEAWDLDELDQLELEILNAALDNPGESSHMSPSKSSGDMSALQDRFQALVKRRLQQELQDRPPLFPWETEISDYEPDFFESEFVPPQQLWTAHLQNLRLPVPIPPDIFSQLLSRCQAVVQSSIAARVKLVRAVEELFPGQSQVLHRFAKVVLTGGSDNQTSELPDQSNFPSSYETATLQEKMVVLLIAARQIIGYLTLNLSPTQPSVERQWLTAVGRLALVADYQIERRLFASLRIQGQFPYGGSMRLQVGDSCAIASRPDPGQLSVELHDLELDQIYPLEVLFPQLDETPLIFGICPTG
jgi:hypothetical protein